jgi:uncharacterized protein (DUF983 family)
MSYAFAISKLAEGCVLCEHTARTTVIADLEKNLVIVCLGIRIMEQVISDLVLMVSPQQFIPRLLICLPLVTITLVCTLSLILYVETLGHQ